MSRRKDQFEYFAELVQDHIENYTVPQYGDAPVDEVEVWTPEQCVLAIQKYTKRFESARRGRLEVLRDMVKIAHFACLTFDKLKSTEEELEKIRKGVN